MHGALLVIVEDWLSARIDLSGDFRETSVSMFYNQGAEVVFRKYVAVQNADVCGSAGKWRVQVEFNRNSGRRVERRVEEKGMSNATSRMRRGYEEPD